MRGLVKGVRRTRQAHIFTSLNLTSLIDLFTILVLFLIFHIAGGSEVLSVSNRLQLPESLSETPPQATVTVVITTEEITVEGKRVEGVQEALDAPDLLIAGLKQELDRHAQKAKAMGGATGTQVFEGKVTILGDRLIPFKLLEKVMFTCSQAEFSDIRLAVIQKETASL
ncbi:MAG TPA: biopolymer transporter ExbD [Nitrospiria bacterium]|nr:biopolymer transporter ExbD [Nitrospiria bacterium]